MLLSMLMVSLSIGTQVLFFFFFLFELFLKLLLGDYFDNVQKVHDQFPSSILLASEETEGEENRWVVGD